MEEQSKVGKQAIDGTASERVLDHSATSAGMNVIDKRRLPAGLPGLLVGMMTGVHTGRGCGVERGSEEESRARARARGPKGGINRVSHRRTRPSITSRVKMICKLIIQCA